MSYNKNRFSRGRNRRPRRIKSFDPSFFISNKNSADHKPKAPTLSEEVINNSFDEFELESKLISEIKSRNFNAPTLIQDKAIPEVLSGRDVVGISNTGTGKTGAFLIPLVHKVLNDKNSRVLIVAPTRELAVQIDAELQMFTRNLNIKSAVCIGGTSIRKQIRQLSNTPQFVIGTPGRLNDLSNQKKVDFNQFNSVVLDEVDRMLDMGFIHDIKKIITKLPFKRQSLFFSATLDDKTKSVMKEFLRNPVIITIQSAQNSLNIHQKTIKVNEQNKDKVLQDTLDDREVVKAIIFVRTKRKVDKLSKLLNKAGFKTTVMHGNKSQNQRQRSLNQFREGKVNTLIATDVAARGIDIDDITHVINFDLPETKEDYIHRIGRTGRLGKKGVAISFIG